MRLTPRARLALASLAIPAIVALAGTAALASPGATPGPLASGAPTASSYPTGSPIGSPLPSGSGGYSPSPYPSETWNSGNPVPSDSWYSGSPVPSQSPSNPPGTGSIAGHFTSGGQGRIDVGVTLYTTSWGFVDYTGTDGFGAFNFQGVAPGDYKIEFSQTGGYQWYHGKADFNSADTVHVVAGAEADIEEQSLPTGTIAGTLTDSSGAAVAGAQVSAQADNGANANAYTDSAGHYSFDLQPGTFRITYFPPGLPYEYAHHALSYQDAAAFTVVSGQTQTVDEQLLPTGTITGRYTAPDGSPVAGASVTANAAEYGSNQSATTAADGSYSLGPVYAGSYEVSFTSPDLSTTQYAHGKPTEVGAAFFAVTGGAATVVNETQLGTGTLVVLGKDAVSGKKVANFCAQADNSYGCTTTGSLTLTGVREGAETLNVYIDDTHHFSAYDIPVTVVAAATTTNTVALQPGATIDVTIKDHVTGAPLENICVAGFTATDAIVPDGFGNCSDAQGVMHIGPLADGPFTLYALDHNGTGYGDQWVGPNGGVGSQTLAAKVYVGAGRTVTGPTILMDKAGSITGTVTGPSGSPVPNAVVSLLTDDPGSGSGHVSALTDAQGDYTMDGLGPYAWPLLVSNAGSLPDQWTGGVANRRNATTPVTVVSGSTATENIQLQGGITMSGVVRTGGGSTVPQFARVVAYNAATGDVMGVFDASPDGAYQLNLLSPQNIKLLVYADGPTSSTGWYGGTSFDTATVVNITGHKNITKDLVYP